MDNLQLCNAVEECVRDYSSNYLLEVKDSLSKEVEEDEYNELENYRQVIYVLQGKREL